MTTRTTITAACSALALAASALAAPGATTVCALKDNRPAAVSFVSDDGIYPSVLHYNALFTTNDLRGTVALVPAWVGRSDAPDSADHGTWQNWADLLAGGRIDYASHGYDHSLLTSLLTGAEVIRQLDTSKQVIEAHFPGYRCITFVYPANMYNAGIRTVVGQRYRAARAGGEADNPLMPSATQFLSLQSRGAAHDTSSARMNAWVDQAISQGTWLIETWHGCGDTSSVSAPCSTIDRHVAYVAARRDRIWCGTFQEVTKYIRERAAANVTTGAVTANSISETLSDTITDTALSFPLTLKTEVQPSWRQVSVRQGSGAAVNANAVQEGSTWYVYYDAVPGAGAITLSSGASAVATVAIRATSRHGESERLYDLHGRTVHGVSAQACATVVAGDAGSRAILK